MNNHLLSLAYADVDGRKAERLKNCATYLAFQRVPEEQRMKLRQANFCRVRLCPMCTWRKSLKAAGQLLKIVDAIKEKEDKPKSYLMLVLTVRNIPGEKLSNSIDEILKGFKRLTELKEFKPILGYFRGLEITHNLNPNSKDYDTFHPHLNVLMAVNQSYFTSRDYISQARWTQLWQQSIRADYKPIVHIHKVKGDTSKAVAEIAKYSIKAEDFVISDDWDMTVGTVSILDKVLHKRRFVGMGGMFKRYHKLLKMDNVEDGDLIHIDPDDAKSASKEDESNWVTFAWFSGYRQYYNIG